MKTSAEKTLAAELLHNLRDENPKACVTLLALLTTPNDLWFHDVHAFAALGTDYLRDSLYKYDQMLQKINTDGISADIGRWFDAYCRFDFVADDHRDLSKYPEGRVDYSLRLDPRFHRLTIATVKTKRFYSAHPPTLRTAILANKNIKAEYERHKRIAESLPEVKKITLDDVDRFIASHTNIPALKAKNQASAQPNINTLAIPTPQLDSETITQKAQALRPESLADVTGFGNDVAIEMAQVVSRLSQYFTHQAAKPHRTLALVEDIIEQAQGVATQNLIKADPSWWERTFSRPRLMDVDSMPLAALVEQAMQLPDHARRDNEALEADLKITDHAIAILDGYHKIITAHKQALADEAPRLSAMPDNDDLIATVQGAGMARSVERSLQRLDGNLAFIKLFAGNFYEIGQLTAETRQSLSGVATLAAVVQTPALQAIQQFKGYTLRRYQQLGGVVDDTISKQFGVVAADMAKATPAYTEQAMSKAISHMIERLSALPDMLDPALKQREARASAIQDTLISQAKHTATPS